MKIIDKKLILNIDSIKSKKEAFELIGKHLVENNFIDESSKIVSGLEKREEQFSTGLGDGVAIPHTSVSKLKKSKIVIIRLKNPIEWKSLDNKKVNLIISILVPKKQSSDHFDILTKLSSNLVNKEVIENIHKFKAEKLEKYLNDMLSKKEDENKNQEKDSDLKKSINVVGVTTCVTGVAHTFIAARALENEGKKRGWNVRIEKQGQMTKDILTQEEIDNADYVIFAKSKTVDDPERFDGKLVYETEVAEPITKAAKVLDDMLKKAKKQEQNSKNSESKVVVKGKKSRPSIMSHMMAGISFMIPYIAMAGIVLGLTTAFGYGYYEIGNPNYAGATGFQPKSPFANALNTLAGGGFTLYIPILGMFIANSIAGRKAMAPAAILALVLNIAPDTSWVDSGNPLTTADGFAPFFNYQTFGFYGWEHSPALGFLGAIASGYLVGYGVYFFTKQTDKIKSDSFQAIVPLLIIPIMFTVIPWLFMAFVGYLPLYGISIGMNWIVQKLIDINMLWLAGGLMGSMICFDLGGPVNKIAMVIGSMMLSQGIGNPDTNVAVVNGVCAVAVSIPPMVLFFSTTGHKFTPLKMDEQDITAGWTASLMGFFGITEGSIPFAAKEAKKWMPSFIIAGFVGGALSTFTGVVDNVPMWGGPIIYIAGGYGSIFSDVSWQASNWTFTLLYFIPLIIAGLVGFFIASLLQFVYEKGNKSLEEEKNQIDNSKEKDKEKDIKIAKSFILREKSILKIRANNLNRQFYRL